VRCRISLQRGGVDSCGLLQLPSNGSLFLAKVNMFCKIFAISVLASIIPAPVFAGDVNAGPIWSNDDAKDKCPRVCRSVGLVWNGNWFTNDPLKNSVCGCDSEK
jgi:hypothetical protein